jgi:hypothetical protein
MLKFKREVARAKVLLYRQHCAITSLTMRSVRSPGSAFVVKIRRFSLSSGDRCPFFQFVAGAFKFVGDELFVWKDSLILRGEHLVGGMVECVVGFCGSLLGAQNESDWRGKS